MQAIYVLVIILAMLPLLLQFRTPFEETKTESKPFSLKLVKENFLSAPNKQSLIQASTVMLTGAFVFGALNTSLPLYLVTEEIGAPVVYLLLQSIIVVASRYLFRKYILSDGKWHTNFMLIILSASIIGTSLLLFVTQVPWLLYVSAIFNGLVSAIVIGLVIGTIAGYIGGWFDYTLMRICDTVMAFPNLLLVIGLVGMSGPGLTQVVTALILVQWVYYARIFRGMVISLKAENYITAAQISGSSSWKIMKKHIVPNILPPLVVMGTLEMGWAIMNISSMSFLGLGVQAPTPEWGAMILEGKSFVRSNPELMLYPGLCIMLVVIIFNLLGESLSEHFGVKRRF